jgi:two-component system OmpR family response regulator
MPFATISSSSQAPHAPDVAARELRILLVEDSVPLQVRLKELLTHAGVMQVTGVADTESAALDLIQSQRFDVMVVDVELRQGSGITVVRKTRAAQDQPPFPLIIILTNYNLSSVRERCLAAGADHFLDKMREFNRLYPLIAAATS